MKDLVNEIKILFEYYNGEAYLSFAIFLFSIIYIFAKEENKKIRNFFIGYSVVILLIIWNPFCVHILNKLINLSSMYRIYYLLPTTIVIAYAFTHFVQKEKKIKKIVLIFFICFTVVITGKLIWNEDTMIKVSNFYKLPDECIEITEIIKNDDTVYKKAMVPYGMSSKIRQIDSGILLDYSRVVRHALDENGNILPSDIDDISNFEPVKMLNEGNVSYLVNHCKERKINYLVIDKSTKLTENIRNYGFYILDETKNYYVYKIDL